MLKPTFSRLLLNWALLTTIAILVSGCSLLPRLTFDRPNSVPQKTVKSERHFYHKTKDGEVTRLDEQNYSQEERKLTLQERLANFIANLKGWGFIILILVVIFCPGLIGWLIGTLFNGFRRALESTVLAIQKAKNNGGDYLKHLNEEHNKDPQVKHLINNLRAKISPQVPISTSAPAVSPPASAPTASYDTPPPAA